MGSFNLIDLSGGLNVTGPVTGSNVYAQTTGGPLAVTGAGSVTGTTAVSLINLGGGIAVGGTVSAPATTLTATGAIDLAMDPASPATLYASTWQRIRRKWNDPRNEPGYGESGVYKSTDGGETWALINTGLPPAASRGRIGLDVARSKPGTLYAFVDDYEIARKANEGERDILSGTKKRIKGFEKTRKNNIFFVQL